jgi:hypothetical protein
MEPNQLGRGFAALLGSWVAGGAGTSLLEQFIMMKPFSESLLELA